MKAHVWYNYMWILEATYLCLGVVNILFAWLGIIFFLAPLLLAIIGGNKIYCQRYCGRGQLLQLIGGKLGISLNKTPPKFLRSLWFRYGYWGVLTLISSSANPYHPVSLLRSPLRRLSVIPALSRDPVLIILDCGSSPQ